MPGTASKNGKAERRERIRTAAQIAASAAKAKMPEDVTLDVNNPYIESVCGGQLDVFDVHDGKQRLLFIVEELPEEQQTPDRKTILHTIRWNCDAFTAHSIAVDGCSGTRTLELQALAETTAAIQREVRASNDNGRSKG